MNIAVLAWRNVRRNPRRSSVTIFAMAFALWVMVLYSGMVEGYLGSMQSDVLDVEVGELQIHGKGYHDDPSIYTVVERSKALIHTLQREGFRASERLRAGGLGASGDASAGILLQGIDVKNDREVTTISSRIAEGKWLDPSAPSEVVVGRRLARTLGVGPGDELLILSQATDGSVANGLYRVRGVLGIVSDGLDRSAVLMTQQAFRDLMVLPTGAHQITVRTPAGMSLSQAKQRVMALAPTDEIETWRELVPTIAMMLDSTRSLLVLVFFILYIAIAILVLNAMLMAVFERIREFGVMKAIGVGPWAVVGMIFLEALLQTTIAIALGLVCALPCMFYLQRTGIDVGTLGGTAVMGLSMRQNWTAVFTVRTVAGPVVALSIMVGLAVLYPAIKAAWIRPVVAMRHR